MATAGEGLNNKIDIGRVVSRGFDTLHRQIWPFLALSLLFSALPTLLAQYLLYQNVGTVDFNDPAARLGFFASPLYWLSLLVSFLGMFMLQGALVRSSILDQNGQPADVGGSIALAIRLLLPMIGLTILSSILIGIGFILLIVPGVIVYLMLIVAVPALVEERRGVIASMSRSRELTKGSRLTIFGLVVLFILFYFVLAMIIGFVGLLGTDSPIVAAIVAAINSTLTGMFMAVMLASLYIELRTVKEGATTDSLASIFE
jgi:uncharacterized membrane protein (DUF485 family)